MKERVYSLSFPEGYDTHASNKSWTQCVLTIQRSSCVMIGYECYIEREMRQEG